MQSTFSNKTGLAHHILSQIIQACDLVIMWNHDVSSIDQYLASPEGMQKMAATCMLIESIGEGTKKFDRLIPGYLHKKAPQTPWKNIMGLRDHIAHGYFNLDAEIIFDVAINEIPKLRNVVEQLKATIDSEMTKHIDSE